MALDENIYDLRREKLKQIEALGQEAYPQEVQIHARDPSNSGGIQHRKPARNLKPTRVNVRVAGRIMAIRLMGKAGFAYLQQGGPAACRFM